jgi:propionyl-CoA carboxylase alpha chain
MRVMKTLLIANRGEIARRITRTARQMGLRTVAVFVADDGQAPHVRDADEAYLLPDGGYLDVGAILDVAQRSAADAVHPGYGFLSENAGFARAVTDAGLIWVGPPPDAIAAMGNKLAAKELAVEVGVPTLPMAEDAAKADSVGYPLLVKAAAGGGGKGMRVVNHSGDLQDAIDAARREAGSAFGDSTVFLERYVPGSRHVEIQVLGDSTGHIVHLGERDCSIQRRHQKIIEESPSPVVDDQMRENMGSAAIRLVKALGYESAGTVEFLVDDRVNADGSRDFYFLEVNTRLQVEHPVTEAVTGLDLVREMLRIAAGEPLGFRQQDISWNGHAIESRLYAEDPANGFLPATGELVAWRPAADPALRWDSGVEQGTVVGPRFDPLLAKVVAHAPTRGEAAAALALALERSQISGLITNRDFLVATLRDARFLAGDSTTDFIERVSPSPSQVLSEAELATMARLGALWCRGQNRATAGALDFLPPGWSNSKMPGTSVTFTYRDQEIKVTYRSARDGTIAFEDGSGADVRSWAPDQLEVLLDGQVIRAQVAEHAGRLYLQTPALHAEFAITSRFPVQQSEVLAGSLAAPMPGVVLDVRVEQDESVGAGQVVVVLEAMKMEHHVRTPTAGRVTDVRVKVGTQVETGQTLLVVAPEGE